MASAMPIAEESKPSRWTLPRWARWVVRLVPVLGIAAAVVTWLRLPHMRLEPALVGLACWTVGNYLICPLRWQSVSTRGRSLAWYARIFAEGELLGMLTPQHAGADLCPGREPRARGGKRPADGSLRSGCRSDMQPDAGQRLLSRDA